jgi:hypothetical protein
MRDLNTSIFLTDEEFGRLFGQRIMQIVGALNRAAAKVCPPCNGYCCENIKCLFYSKKFSTCPIFAIRPRECRYHFCNDVFVKAQLTQEEKDLMVGPVEELICGDHGEIARLFFLFPEFPLDAKGLESMGIKPEVERIKKAFEDGVIREGKAFELLNKLCRGVIYTKGDKL